MSTSDALDTPVEKQPLQIDVTVDEKSACERHVVVKIGKSEVERYRQDSFNEVAPKAELPGFRAGKAPRKLVETRFKDQVDEQVKSNLIMDSLQQVTESDHFSAISEPEFDYEAVELPSDRDFTYEFNIEVRPEFDTPEWKGLELTRPVGELTDKHIEDHLALTLSRLLPGEPVDGECKLGDEVTLNIEFFDDGKEIGKVEEESTVIRAELNFGDAAISNFGELISGKKEGDEFTTNVTISEEAADEALRGKEIEAKFSIVEARRLVVDELNDEMLDSIGFDDSKELREFVRSELEKQADYHQRQAVRKQIVDELTKDADWEMPESLVRKQTNRELQRMMLELQRNGLDQAQIQSYLNVSRMNAQQTTVRALREHFLLEKIAEDLEIEPSPEDYDKEIELLAAQSDQSPRRVRARLEKTGQMDAIRNQIIERMVIEKIEGEAKVTEEEDLSFLKPVPESSSINYQIAGDFDDIPDAKHDNDPAQMPGAPKLPEKEKEAE